MHILLFSILCIDLIVQFAHYLRVWSHQHLPSFSFTFSFCILSFSLFLSFSLSLSLSIYIYIYLSPIALYLCRLLTSRLCVQASQSLVLRTTLLSVLTVLLEQEPNMRVTLVHDVRDSYFGVRCYYIRTHFILIFLLPPFLFQENCPRYRP